MPRPVQPEKIASLASGLDLPLLKAIYGFGSYFEGKETAADVDILLVFADEAMQNRPEALRQAEAFNHIVTPEFGDKPHLTRLTERECAATGFIGRVGARLIWQRPGKAG